MLYHTITQNRCQAFDFSGEKFVSNDGGQEFIQFDDDSRTFTAGGGLFGNANCSITSTYLMGLKNHTPVGDESHPNSYENVIILDDESKLLNQIKSKCNLPTQVSISFEIILSPAHNSTIRVIVTKNSPDGIEPDDTKDITLVEKSIASKQPRPDERDHP